MATPCVFAVAACVAIATKNSAAAIMAATRLLKPTRSLMPLRLTRRSTRLTRLMPIKPMRPLWLMGLLMPLMSLMLLKLTRLIWPTRPLMLLRPMWPTRLIRSSRLIRHCLTETVIFGANHAPSEFEIRIDLTTNWKPATE